ncbi:glutamate-cysteine ligase family protein [Alkalibaculum sporogenes]|nr:glutamate-cysteine ligase family protein [Alkalibaculum sporogenes]
MNFYEVNLHNIVEYIKKGEKSKDNLTIGLEFEHIIVDKESFKSISFEDGIIFIMEKLLLHGWKKSDNEPWLLNLVKNEDNISLEPGAQFELSMKNCTTIKEIKERYFSFVNDILPILDESNYYLLSIGYRPIEKIKDISIIPKLRYKHMSEYLSQKGKYALNMMKGSASLQLSVDYTDEEDYIKKNKVANYLSPAISLLFDNTPIFEGEVFDGNTPRVEIWNNMDNDRSRIAPGVFEKEFGYKDYAEYVLNRPSIISLLGGNYVYTGEKLIKDVYKDIELDERQIEHLLSMFFPDVRTKRYIEIRMTDSVPYPYNIAAAALWKGILYDDTNLNYFYNQAKDYSDHQVECLKDCMIKNDDIALVTLDDMINDILSKSMNALDDEDKAYLKPLLKLNKNHYNLATYIKSELKNGIPTALEINALSIKNINGRGII